MLEVQGIATDRNDVFPYSGLRVLGFIQLTNGLLVFLVGVIDLTITMVTYNDAMKTYGPIYDGIVTMTVASTPLWSGMWFALTGSLGTCITRARSHTLQFFKITFLVLNILCAALFGPVCAVISGLIAIQRHSLDAQEFQWLVNLLLCFMAVLEIFLAIATSSVTCCCSPVRGTQVHVLVQSGPPASTHPQPDPPTSGGKSATINDSFESNPAKERGPQHVVRAEIEEPQHRYDGRSVERPRQRRDHDDGPTEQSEHKFDGFGDSHSFAGSYSKLKKWSLPGW